jgi:hypothetical protein
MLFGLPAFAAATWWTYNESTFRQKFESSWSTPIYALCWSHSCPHCQGLPERFQTFSSSMAAHSDVIFTAISIANTTGCSPSYLHAKFLPYWVFARGTNPKYWLFPQFSCPLRWIEFVSDWANPIARPLSPDGFNETLNSTFNGGSSFFLEIPDDRAADLAVYKKLSAQYHVINNSFAYALTKEKAMKLSVFWSPHCGQTFEGDGLNLASLIDANKFSHFHHFDGKEWKRLRKRSLLIVDDKELNQSRAEVLSELSREFCHKVDFGWQVCSPIERSPRHSKRRLIHRIGLL